MHPDDLQPLDDTAAWRGETREITLRIWIDADACPGPVRDIVIRGAERVRVPVVFVANRPLSLPRSPMVSTVQVGRGLDVADTHIAMHAGPGGNVGATRRHPGAFPTLLTY